MPYLGASPRNINTRSVIDHQEYLGSQADTSTNSGYYTFYVNYTPGNVSVVIRGVHMASSDYTATNGTDVRISTSTITLANDDVIEIIGYGIPSSQILERSDVNITGGQAVNLTQVGASSYKVGNTEVIDSSRIVDAASVKVAGTEVIDSNKSLNVFDVKVGGNTVIDSNRKMTGVDIVPTTNFTFRNRIINGDMRIDQRNDGAVVTNNGEYPVDRWLKTGNPSASLQRSTIAPDGYTNSLLTTITATGDSSSTLRITQHIEGFNVSNLGWGSGNAKSVTVSFMVRSSVEGTYSVRLSNSPSDRVYFSTFTISLADTWYYKSLTISGDTTPTWLTDNGRGITISFVLAGSTAVTPNAWGTTGTSATGQTNLCLTNGATFYITGVQLEEGTVATPFEHRPISVELSLAQRYYQKSFPMDVAPAQNIGGDGALYCQGHAANAPASGFVIFPTPMRDTPSTLLTFNPSATNGKWRNLNTSTDINQAIYSSSSSGFFLYSNTQVLSQYEVAAIQWSAHAEL